MLPTNVYKGETDFNNVIFPFGVSSMFVSNTCTFNTPESVLGGNCFFILNMFVGEQFQAQIAFGFQRTEWRFVESILHLHGQIGLLYMIKYRNLDLPSYK